MKQLLGILLLLGTFSSNAQTIGIQGNFNAHTDNILESTPYRFSDDLNGGVFFSAPIYKRLEYNVGLNLVNMAMPTGYNGPRLMDWSEPYLLKKHSAGIVEAPVEIVTGLYRKNSIAKAIGYFHVGYAIGTNVYNRYAYANTDDKIVERSNNPAEFANTLYHTFRVELEVRWLIQNKYSASFFFAQRNTAYKYYNNQKLWSHYLGLGFRFGFVLPKQAKA